MATRPASQNVWEITDALASAAVMAPEPCDTRADLRALGLVSPWWGRVTACALFAVVVVLGAVGVARNLPAATAPAPSIPQPPPLPEPAALAPPVTDAVQAPVAPVPAGRDRAPEASTPAEPESRRARVSRRAQERPARVPSRHTAPTEPPAGERAATPPADVRIGESDGNSRPSEESAPEQLDAPEENDIELQLYAVRTRRLIRQHYGGHAGTCFESRSRNNEGLRGRVVLDVTVGASGSVDATEVRSNNTGDAVLARCLQGRVGTWRFPAPPGGELTLAVPFSY